jgi:hypothetical protein
LTTGIAPLFGRSQCHLPSAIWTCGYGGSIGRVRWSTIFGPFLQSSGSQLFAISTLIDKIPFESIDLQIEQIVSLMNQADNRIGSNGCIAMLQPSGIQRPALLV